MVSHSQTLSYLKQRFEEAGIRLQTRHGQNFLIDLNLQRVIVEAAQLSPNDVVLEVGTGTGALAALMAPHVAHLVTVEIDRRLYQLAGEELIDLANVTMLEQDALKSKNTLNPAVLAAVYHRLDEAPGRRFKLVANLPYSVATPLVSNLLALERAPESMTVTIQKELVDRMLAQPHTKAFGALSLWVQCQCRVELLRIMPPDVFWPRPKVDSAIVRIVLDHQRRRAIADREFFHDMVRRLFQHRRKFLRGVLAAAYQDQLDKATVDAILASLNIAPNARAEELSVEQMLALAEAVCRRVGA